LPDKYERPARVYVDTQSLLRPLMSRMAITPDAGGQVAILQPPSAQPSEPRKDHFANPISNTSAGTNAADLVDLAAGSLSIARAGTGDNLYTMHFAIPTAARRVT